MKTKPIADVPQNAGEYILATIQREDGSFTMPFSVSWDPVQGKWTDNQDHPDSWQPTHMVVPE